MTTHTPTVLAIAGFDPYAGAGITMDTKTIHACGGYAISVVTALTAQNSQGVYAVEVVPASFIEEQLERLLSDIDVDAVKIGMLGNRSAVEVVAKVLKRYQIKEIILDPVLISTSGAILLDRGAIEVMIEKLFPLCKLITPNLYESELLLGNTFKGDEISQISQGFFDLKAKAVLLKGGHTQEKEAIDRLIDAEGVRCFVTSRVKTSHTHGTGCLLSSAIATNIAYGKGLDESIATSKAFLYQKLQSASDLKLCYKESTCGKTEPIF